MERVFQPKDENETIFTQETKQRKEQQMETREQVLRDVRPAMRWLFQVKDGKYRLNPFNPISHLANIVSFVAAIILGGISEFKECCRLFADEYKWD